jgi:thioredoxin-like negative regulator of GroEL
MRPAPELLESLRKAVEAMPEDLALRLHLATMLQGAGFNDEMIRQVGAILQRDPGNVAAMALLTAAEVSDTAVSEQDPPPAAGCCVRFGV